MNYRVGVDIGGTFTDLVLVGPDGATVSHKLLTTPSAPEQAILTGVRALLERADVDVEAVSSIIHGTTLVANAIIERKGVPTALITTVGMRDVLEIGRELRYDTYDPFITVPPPLVPRRHRYEVSERLDASGTVIDELDDDSVLNVFEAIRAVGIESVAVCLLHAYKNPVHEQRIATLAREHGFDVTLSLSSEVMPEIREYERTSTTVANAYVKPIVDAYLDDLAHGLSRLGIRAPFNLMLSDGGTVDMRTAAEHPIRLVQSGPAGGVYAAQRWGASAERPDLLAFDMGGTTAKACLIVRGEPSRTSDFEVAREYRFKQGSGLPLKVPVVEMLEIGCGGGSIASIDGLGLIRVGPESAGAEPGPACYGSGGKSATVTDADLLLGYLSPDNFLGGAMRLDVAAAEAAVRSAIAEPLGLDVIQAAWGIHEMANESMASAASVHALEKGLDVSRFSLFASGGAGPVHAVHIAQRLGMAEVVCPIGAGVSSAYGFLTAPFAFEFSRSNPAPVDAIDFAEVQGHVEDMEGRARALLEHAGVASDEVRVEVTARMRYLGQGYEILVPVPKELIADGHHAPLRDVFDGAYLERYGTLQDSQPEVVSWRVVARSRPPAMAEPPPPNATGDAPSEPHRKGRRPVYFSSAGDFIETDVYDRHALAPGQEIAGPVIIEESESTVVVPPGCDVSVDRFRAIIVRIAAERRGSDGGEGG